MTALSSKVFLLAFLQLALLTGVSADYSSSDLELGTPLDSSTCPPDDLSSNDFTINCGGGVTPGATGQYNTAFSFDGVDDNLSVPYNSVFDDHTFSINTWVYINTFPDSGTDDRIQDIYGGGSYGYSLNVQGNQTFAVTTTGSNGAGEAYSNQTISGGSWHMVTANYDSGTVEFYIDGEPSGTSTIPDFSNVSGNLDYFIGANQQGGDLNLDGRLDEYRHYNRVLNDSEIDSLYTSNSLPGGSNSAPSLFSDYFEDQDMDEYNRAFESNPGNQVEGVTSVEPYEGSYSYQFRDNSSGGTKVIYARNISTSNYEVRAKVQWESSTTTAFDKLGFVYGRGDGKWKSIGLNFNSQEMQVTNVSNDGTVGRRTLKSVSFQNNTWYEYYVNKQSNYLYFEFRETDGSVISSHNLTANYETDLDNRLGYYLHGGGAYKGSHFIDSVEEVGDVSLTVDTPVNGTIYDDNVTLKGSTSSEANVSVSVDGGSSQSICSNCTSFSYDVGFSDFDNHTFDVQAVKYDSPSKTDSVFREVDLSSEFKAFDSYGFNFFQSSINNVDVGSNISLSQGSSQGTYESYFRQLDQSQVFNTLDVESSGWSNWEMQTEIGEISSTPNNPVFIVNKSWEYPYRLTGTNSTDQRIWKCKQECYDYSNWVYVDTVGGNGTGVGWNHGYYAEGKFWMFTSTDSYTALYSGPNLTQEGLTYHGEVISGEGDCGGYYDSDTGRHHVYCEADLVDGEPSGNKISHLYAQNPTDPGNWTNASQRIAFDATDYPWYVGDADIIRFDDGRCYMTVDKTGDKYSHPNYRVALTKSTDGCNTFEYVETITSTPGGDIDIDYAPTADEWWGWTELTGSDNDGYGFWNSTGLFEDTVEANVSFDTTGDGSLDYVSGWNTLSASYSNTGSGSLHKENISLGFPVSDSYGQKLEFRLSSSSTNPSVGGFQLFNSNDVTPPSITIDSPLNQTYNSSEVDLNVTSSEAANFTYNNGAGNVTVNENDQDLNETLTGLSQGEYTVDVWATDSAGNTGYDSVSYTVDTDPTASFSVNQTTLDINETVEFDGSGSTDNGSITDYSWTFGDGSTGSGEVVTHSYSDSGSYTVELTVTDDQGNTDSTTKTLDVTSSPGQNNKSLVDACPAEPFCHKSSNPQSLAGSFHEESPDQVYTWTVNATGSAGDYEFFSFFNSSSSRIAEAFTNTTLISILDNTTTDTNSAPSADFTVSLTDLSVSTDASGSSDSDGTISSYEWDWTNDGNYEDTGVTASHTYPSNGTYTIKLRVTDDDGATSTLTKTVSVSSSTSDGDGGSDGGGSGGDDTTVSVDGSSATLLAPHSGARYSKSTFTINEGGSNTISINGNEHTFEVDNIVSSTEAQIVLDGVSQSWKEEQIETISGLDVSLVDVAQKGSGGTVSFTLASAVDLNEPVAWYAYNYTINESGSIELQVREAGPGNSWSTIDSNTVSSTVDNQYVNLTQNTEAGIYEARLRLNASGNTSTSNVNGFYSGEVPRLEITNPSQGEQIKQPRTPTKNIPLDYEYELREWSNVTDSGQLYIDSNGNKYSIIVDRSVETVAEDTWFESFTKLVTGLSVDEVYSSGFSWFYPTEPDVYQVDTTMQINGDFGDYTGYVNVTVNDSTGSNKTVYSYGRNVEIIPQSTDDYINDNKDSEVVNTGERTFNTTYSVDQDGDGTPENVSIGTLVTGLDTPANGSRVTVSNLDEGVVDFHFFAMNVNGTALLNKSLVLKDVENDEVVRKERLAPGKNEYRIDLNGTEVNEWEQKRYRYSVEYFEPGTNDVSLYNSTQDNISNTFTVQRAGLKDLASRIIDPLVDAFTTIYDVSSEYAGFIMALVATVGWYIVSKVRGLDFLAKAGAATIFSVAWWYGLIPANIQALVLGILALIVTIKLWRGEVTL